MKSLRIFARIMTLGLLSLGGVSGVHANKPDPADSHCVIRAQEGVDQNGTYVSGNEKPEMDCYTTFPEAIEMATDGRVLLPSDATPETLTPEQINSMDIGTLWNAAPMSAYVMGIHYEHTNFGGASLVVTWSCPCDWGCSCQIPSLGGNWWNDRISSVATYSGCNVYSFEHSNFRGRMHMAVSPYYYANMCQGYPYYDCYMNDRTSSMQYY